MSRVKIVVGCFIVLLALPLCKEKSDNVENGLNKEEVVIDDTICYETVRDTPDIFFGAETKQCSVFYKGGELAITYFKDDNDSLYGVYKKYYPSGVLKLKGYYRLGLKYGNFYYYRKNGSKSRKDLFLFGTEKRSLSERVFFDSSGNIIKDKGFLYDVDYPDTLYTGDSLSVEIDVIHPKTDCTSVAVGYNRHFTLKNENELSVFKTDTPYVKFSIKPEGESGPKTFRGMLWLKTPDSSDMRGYAFPFERDYFVVSKKPRVSSTSASGR